MLKNGHRQIADGVDYVSGFYHADVKAWKLCDSQFPGTCIDVETGLGCDVDLRAMVPDSFRGRRLELPR